MNKFQNIYYGILLDGYSDGDGCFYRSKNRKGESIYLSYALVGTEDFCNKTSDFITSELNITSTVKKTKSNCYQCCIQGNLQVEKLINALYKNHDMICLKRKYETVKNFMHERGFVNFE